jgi:hypothetical protein
MSKFRGVKTNNAKTNAKQQIRESALCAIDGEKYTLEVYCGAGEMYQSVWHQSDIYMGIDKVKFFDERNTICGDARKAIRLVDISKFNIFDIDAYGSPYEILADILPLVGCHKKIAFVLTDGTNMDLKLGRISKGMRFFTGIDFHIAKRANVLHDDFIKDVIAKTCEMLNGKAEGVRIAKGVKGSAMRYYCFIVNRDAD